MAKMKSKKRKNKKEKKNDTISKWMRMKNVAILHAWMFITRVFSASTMSQKGSPCIIVPSI
ncbi:hypothetical protein Lal_00043218 [Lupinus albus]|nr:hypothetical protein Lal_00043218 [Lupinus albus]